MLPMPIKIKFIPLIHNMPHFEARIHSNHKNSNNGSPLSAINSIRDDEKKYGNTKYDSS